MARQEARQTLAACNVPVGSDFHALHSEQVAALLQAANAANYRQPRNANGSRARYFHARLERLASFRG